MSSYQPEENRGTGQSDWAEPVIIVAEVVPESPPQPAVAFRRRRRRVWLPMLLFLATCLCTFWAGLPHPDAVGGWSNALLRALLYAGPLMTILICHEGGHFIQARRHGVYTSFPFFIPMPIGPLGTIGAVIGMEPRIGNRRALFEIGITGPLAGLVPTLIFCIVGLKYSKLEIPEHVGAVLPLGEPLLFKMLSYYVFGPLPEGKDVILHPTAFAGWVGLLLTAINLIPIGQLDGGHVLYALLRRKAHHVASLLLLAALAMVILFGYWWWWLMVFLLILMGARHPPTADDNVPLGPVRIVLGWLTLAFILVGFTPTPFLITR